MWDLVQPHLLDGRTYASYLELLARRGMPEFKIQEMGREHEQYWEQAVALVRDMGGVEPMVLACVERAIEMLARLWEQSK